MFHLRSGYNFKFLGSPLLTWSPLPLMFLRHLGDTSIRKMAGLNFCFCLFLSKWAGQWLCKNSLLSLSVGRRGMWSQGAVLQVLQWTDKRWGQCVSWILLLHFSTLMVPNLKFYVQSCVSTSVSSLSPLIHNLCCLCISYDCALLSGASPCSQEQIHCSPEDSTVIQAVRVPKSIVVWASSCAGFIWSSGLCLKADTRMLFPLMINKQLQSFFFFVRLLAFSNHKLHICLFVQGQLEEHMAVLIVQSCHSFCQVVVSLHVAGQHLWKSPPLPAPALFPNKGMSERGVKPPTAGP